MSLRPATFGAALALVLAGTAAAATEVEARLQPGALSFTGGAGFTNAELKITGPDDFEAEESSRRGLPTFRLQGGRMKDGFYHYTLSAATDEREEIKKPIDNGRGDAARDYVLKPFYMSGMFEVSRGTIVPAKEAGEGGDVDQ